VKGDYDINVRLTKDERDWLDDVAAHEDIPVSQVVRKLIREKMRARRQIASLIAGRKK
jgi:hypothetical protein